MAVTSGELARTLRRRAAARRSADDRDAEECRRAVLAAIPALREILGFGRVWLIGSLAWGGFGVRSDIDIVVEGAAREALLRISDAVGEATRRAVDVLALEELTPAFQSRVLADGQSVA